MAKQSSLASAPVSIPLNRVEENYLKVTIENKSEILVIGRPVYIFEQGITKHKYLGCFDIRPRMKKGMLTTTGHPLFGSAITKVNETENEEDYLKSIQSVVNIYIEKEQLYYNPNDKLITYQHAK